MKNMTENRAYGATGDEKPPPAYYPDTNDGQISGYDNVTPPPTYTQTQNEAPPPSYDSIFGEIRAAQRNAEGRGHFLKSVCEILLNTTAFTISICLLFAIPVLMIVVGALNLDNCPIERLIPLWLIVAGASTSLSQLLSLFKRMRKKCKGDEEGANSTQDSSQTHSCFSGILGCFNLAWFFAGNVWVYRRYRPNTTDPDSVFYCDHTTYYLSFWLITAVYIVVMLFCCCSCCLATCTVGGGSSSSSNDR